MTFKEAQIGCAWAGFGEIALGLDLETLRWCEVRTKMLREVQSLRMLRLVGACLLNSHLYICHPDGHLDQSGENLDAKSHNIYFIGLTRIQELLDLNGRFIENDEVCGNEEPQCEC